MHPLGANWADFNPSDPVSNLGPPLPTDKRSTDTPCNQVRSATTPDQPIITLQSYFQASCLIHFMQITSAPVLQTHQVNIALLQPYQASWLHMSW